jgi:release factor glutamine methyltransferase
MTSLTYQRPANKKNHSTKKMPTGVLDAVNRASVYLKDLGIESHRLDSELIVAKVLNVKRIDLYLMHDRPLTNDEWKEIGKLIVKRGEGLPTAYITGIKEFWSLSFLVNQSVLIPRPETEILVEEGLALVNEISKNKLSILEIGTGTGAIAASFLKELPEANITATDISQDALDVAKTNFENHGISDRVTLLNGSVYEPVAPENTKFDLIVSNPPYISSEQMATLPVEIKREPSIALNGSIKGCGNGLDIIRPIIKDAPSYLSSVGYLILEIGSDQFDMVKNIINESPGLSFLRMRRDYASLPRVVVATKS